LDYKWRVAVLTACSMIAAVSIGCGGESADPSSGMRVEGTHSGDCEDEADNDGDGLYDCDDPSCDSLRVCIDRPGGSGGTGGAGGSGGGGSPGTGGTGGSTGTGGTAGAGGLGGECPTGPLAAPIANCQPATPPSTGDPELDCVERINQLRWNCQCLPPLQRWTAAESCADQHAEYDSTRPAHSGFRDGICTPDGWAQNECPSWGSIDSVIAGCLQSMWDEGPGEPYEDHGHYINMTNPDYTMVACGFYETPDGEVWSVQNFQ